MNIYILTLFPSVFKPIINESIIKRAQKNKKVNIEIFNIRNWAKDKHNTVDDKTYGGGAGMILKANIIDRALADIKKTITNNKDTYTILTDPRGKRYSQDKAQDLSKKQNIIIVCGHYGGIDERVNKLVDDRISIGNFVLTGGEVPAMAIVDSVVRLIPGVINSQSLSDESHSKNIKKQFPQYTRPEHFKPNSIKTKKNLTVPRVLLSGNHKKISNWRKSKIK